MTIFSIFMLLIFMVALDMVVTFKLYRSVQDECDEKLKQVRASIDCLRREIATYRLSIDGKIEKAIAEAKPKPRRKRRQLKDEKKEECKNQGKK